MPFKQENLPLRLFCDITILRNKCETLSPKEFVTWERQRDASSMEWRYQSEEKLYYPVR